MELDQRDVRYARNGDVSIAYMVLGKGPVDLLWSSPGISNVEILWDESSPYLRGMATRLSSSKGFSRFITYDQRGAGLSDPVPPNALPTLEERGDDIRAVLDAAGSERAAILAQGHGGPACILFAASHPDRVSHLILYDTYSRWLRDVDYPQGMPLEATMRYRDSLKEVWGTGATIDLWAPSLAHLEEERQMVARAERVGASLAQVNALMAMWTETDVRDVLPSVRVPTLIMNKTGDDQFRVGHGRYLAEKIPGAKYLEFPGADHLWMGEDLETLSGEVEEFVTGRRSIPASDRVLATVMFTDVVDSTLRASEIGDRAWTDLLDRHDETIRRHLSRYRGTSFKQTGDGIGAIFDGATRAVTCACAIRDSLRGHGLEIRAGLHTGEIERRGDDVAGMAVNIAARVASLGKAGEVLVSSTVRDLVIGSGLRFEERGLHELKGAYGKWQLLSVIA